jgi:carboxylate-amine ligase
MREALLGRHVPHGNGAVLTSGPSTAAYYEHQRLASELGFDLVVADDLAVRDGRVHALTTGTPLDALYLRLDDELADLRRADGGRVGTEILAVAADGAVVLANAPGNGVADDKAMYAVVPELIAYYLGEPALLAGVPTYRLGHPEERRMVLGRLGDLVTKPVDGYGGSGVLIGPAASAHELDQRRRDIVRDPEGWVAQEVVSLSSHPTWDGARMEPRRVDLRAFVHVRGTEPHDCRLADLALTRVAPPHGHLVNTSQGGGITDTWIVTDPGDGSR